VAGCSGARVVVSFDVVVIPVTTGWCCVLGLVAGRRHGGMRTEADATTLDPVNVVIGLCVRIDFLGYSSHDVSRLAVNNKVTNSARIIVLPVWIMRGLVVTIRVVEIITMRSFAAFEGRNVVQRQAINDEIPRITPKPGDKSIDGFLVLPVVVAKMRRRHIPHMTAGIIGVSPLRRWFVRKREFAPYGP